MSQGLVLYRPTMLGVLIALGLVGLLPEPGVVRPSWRVEGSAPSTGTLHRRTAGSPWAARSPVVADGVGLIELEDRDVQPSDRFAYRLVLGSGPDAFTTPEVWVDVPSEVAFSLRGVHPNPNPGDQLLVSFSLAEREPATLELVDVSGRRVSEHTIDSPEPRASSNAALEDCRPAFISSGSARVRADSPPSCAWSANGGPRSGSPRSILSTWGQRELAMRSVFPATRRAPSASQPATAPGP